VWLAGWLAAGLLVSLIPNPARGLVSRPQAPAAPAVAVANGGAGPCSADFVVTDAAGKAIYAAKIDIQLQYGFMGLHKLGAMVNTNSDGKARIEGLPDKIKKTAEFNISYQNESKSLPYDPIADCHPHLQVTLGGK
jgi:hypothetical protein